MKRWMVLGVVTMLFASGVVGVAVVQHQEAQLPLKQFSCGGQVTKSVRLANDVGPNCSGSSGLDITASGITLDLNGHTVDGNDGAFNGINATGVTRVTIRNGRITDFFDGVFSTGSRNSIQNVRVSSSVNEGIYVSGANSLVRGNQVFNNPGGIQVFGNAMHIVGNTVQNSVSEGILISSAHGNVITGNRVLSNGSNGISELNSSTVGNTISRNIVDSNDGNGINILGERTRVFQNTADHNTGLGINAVAGTIDGGGNHANGNSSAHQCENVAC